ncbi:hypothetical protein [Streptomyces sp. NPDC002187]|uniref:hypothetical protein n=1 Tax=Streptomyces sp. NPDC002187 TaxID=3364637 RepID=UPI0036C236A9
MGWVDPLPGGRLLLHRPGSVEVHERESFLNGGSFLARRSQPLSSLTLRPGSGMSAAPTPDGGWAISDVTRMWTVRSDGTTRWELPEDILPGGIDGLRIRGTPSVSPDGSLVTVVVSMLGTEPSEPVSFAYDGRPLGSQPATDVLLLLDAASGEVLGRQEIAVESVDARLEWHPDGHLVAVSCWGLWRSWTTHWLEAHRDGLHRLGGMSMGQAVGFVPGSSRLLTVRRAENFAADDDVNELAVHDTRTSERLALFDPGELLVTPDSADRTDVHLLDAAHVIVAGDRRREDGQRWEGAHWLCDAATLRPLGRLRYSRCPLYGHVQPLGDGTWVTRHGSRVHRWSLP